MRKMVLAILVLAGAAAGLSLPPAASATGGCVTYCTEPNPCGYVCCYRQCCGRICVDLDCAPPPFCPGDN